MYDILKKNKINHTIGFVLCGKTLYDSDFDAYELWWDSKCKPLESEDKPKSLKDEPIIKSGDGKICLEAYLRGNNELETKEFWKLKNTSEAKKELS